MRKRTDTKADRRWLTKNPSEPVFYLPSVSAKKDLPPKPKPWNAVWVKEENELFVFAFNRWMKSDEMYQHAKALGAYE